MKHSDRTGRRYPRPLHAESFPEALRQWEIDIAEWRDGKRLWEENGMVETASSGPISIAEAVAKWGGENPPTNPPYRWWNEQPHKPQRKDYMPDWRPDQRTHFMMYENTSEGTPISPAFATAEELARWLADNNASAFADMGATYEQWLNTIRRGSAISAVFREGEMVSGVQGMAEVSA
jgi:hypothetical protein